MAYGPNICTGGTATAQNEGFGYVIANAFDGNWDTFWHTDGGSVDCWAKYDLGAGKEKIAAQYVIKVRRSSMYRYPTAWLFQGSNDDTYWTTIDEQTGMVFVDGVSQTFNAFTNTTAYRYYRWRFTGSSDAYHNIGELEIMEAPPPPVVEPANYLITRMRDRFLQKGVSLGLPVLTDQYRSFLIARHNRLRTLGVSLEPAVPRIKMRHIMPIRFTANNAPSPWVLSAITEYSGEFAAYYAGCFGESGGRWSNNGSGSNGAWVKIDSGGDPPLLVTNMLIKSYPGQGVNAFKVQGSNDDSLWIDLYEGSAADNSNFQWFSFENDTPYRYHRLLYTGAGFGGNYTSIYVLCFWSLQETPSPLVYDTFDPVLKWGVVADFSNGDLTVACLGGAWAGCASQRPKNAGKWYWEITCDDAGDYEIGIVTPQLSATLYSYRGNSGNKIDIAGTSTAYGAAYDYPNVISVAVDFDARKIWFGKNGVWQNSGDPAAGTGAAFENIVNYPCWRPGVLLSSSQVTANFGASAFQYTPPAGFNPGWYAEE